MSFHKPIPLILDVALYDIIGSVVALPPEQQATVTEEMLIGSIARTMLGQIAQFGSMEAVFKVLGAIGGPANDAEMTQRIAAAKDAAGYKQPPKADAAKTAGAAQ